MHGRYFFDEEHIAEWLDLSKTDEGVQKYADKYIFAVKEFDEYLELCGGVKKMNFLKKREQLRVPLVTPWRK
jgi:glutaconate CoA-transferase subunit A